MGEPVSYKNKTVAKQSVHDTLCVKPEVNASRMIYGRAHKKERAWRWETQAQGASPMGRAAHCLTLDLPCVCDHIDTSPTFFGAAVGSIGSYLVFVGTQDKSMSYDEWFRYEVVHMRKFVAFASRWCRVEVEQRVQARESTSQTNGVQEQTCCATHGSAPAPPPSIDDKRENMMTWCAQRVLRCLVPPFRRLQRLLLLVNE